MMQIDSMELPNATDDCIEEIWEEEGGLRIYDSFPDLTYL